MFLCTKNKFPKHLKKTRFLLLLFAFSDKAVTEGIDLFTVYLFT